MRPRRARRRCPLQRRRRNGASIANRSRYRSRCLEESMSHPESCRPSRLTSWAPSSTSCSIAPFCSRASRMSPRRWSVLLYRPRSSKRCQRNPPSPHPCP
eukprot:7350030-Pyramimonas_sp.AAC.1